MGGKREDYEFELDGMVIKVNELKIQERSGFLASSEMGCSI